MVKQYARNNKIFCILLKVYRYALISASCMSNDALKIHYFIQDRDNNMNLVHMLESFTFRNHVCMTFELLSMNLYELIKKNRFQVGQKLDEK